jgi:hypothetical protein
MRHACVLLLAAGIFVLIGNRPLIAQSDMETDSAKLQLEVDALSSLSDLKLTPDQLSALKDLASDTAGTLSEKPAAISDTYKAALDDTRRALLGKDEDKIEAAEDKMGDLQDKEDPDSEPDVDQSETAKTKAETLLKRLSANQVANFVAQNADDLEDPTQLLLDAIHQCRGMSDDDFADLRDDTTEELGIYAAGINPSRPSAIAGKASRLLSRVHKLSADEYNDQQSALEDEARKLVGGLDPVNVLRHWLDDELADLLSNPELPQAIDELSGAGNK